MLQHTSATIRWLPASLQGCVVECHAAAHLALVALQANSCLDADSLPSPVSGCCREPCSTLTKAGQTFSGVCCPTGAQIVAINGVLTRICCPQGTTVQPDGSCKPSSITCALPNVPCNSWPSLATLTCCPEAQCLPVLPLTNTAATACCQQVGHQHRHGADCLSC
jgi:hypothetical protein